MQRFEEHLHAVGESVGRKYKTYKRNVLQNNRNVPYSRK